jgi:hypothetical protein
MRSPETCWKWTEDANRSFSFLRERSAIRIGYRGGPSLACQPEFKIALVLLSILFPVPHRAEMIPFMLEFFSDTRGKLAV